MTSLNYRWRSRLAALVMVSMAGLAGTAVAAEGDPFEPANRNIYTFNDGLDRNFIRPVAEGYVKVTPEFFRTAVTNFFANVGYLNVIANDLLQGKLVQFFQDSGRFVVNSTVGIGGLFDPASGMGLHANNEDLGQTFGVWGATEGAYLMLPLFGPDSFRDVGDRVTSTLLNPLFYVGSVVLVPMQALNAVNTRANFLDATRVRDQAALDPYAFTREAWRQRREFLIYDGNPPAQDLDEFLEEDTESVGPDADPGAVLKVF